VSTSRRTKAVWEWLWRGGALERARTARAAGLPPLQARRLEHAREMAAAAARLRWHLPGARGGSPVAALTLLREAAYWAIRAFDDEPDDGSLKDALRRLPPAVLSSAGDGDAAAVERALTMQTVSPVSIDEQAQEADAERARALVERLLARAADRRSVGDVLLERWGRMAVAITLLVALTGGGAGLALEALRGPDLAAHAAWKTSGSYGDYPGSGTMDLPHPKKPLFHTDRHKDAWFEIDLGTTRQISRVEIENRRDCCAERASPLIVEVRSETGAWEQIARNAALFETWTVTMAPRRARYVRLRAARETWLHLNAVVVRR
jgi:hypothetical protein